MRVSEVAAALTLTPRRVYQLVETGELPATRIGHAIRIPRLAFEVWVALQTDRAIEQMRHNVERPDVTPSARETSTIAARQEGDHPLHAD